MDDEEILKCGWLTKKGAFNLGGWKRRWFVLKNRGGGEAVLCYYRKQADSVPAGEVLLDQSTLAYHNVDSDKAHAFSIQTKGRTYEMLAPTQQDMMDWIESLMQAALGIHESRRKLPHLDAKNTAWLKFHALGMQCECCWEQLPDALTRLAGVEVVRIDPGADIVSVRLAKDLDEKLPAIVERVMAIMQERFGFVVTFLPSGQSE